MDIAVPLRQGAGHQGRIGIFALVGNQFSSHVFGVGITGRNGNAARLGHSHQGQVAPVLPVVLRFDQQQEGNRPILRIEIGKESRVPGPAAGRGTVKEMRTFAQADPAPDPVIEQAVRIGIPPDDMGGNIIVLGKAAHVSVDEPSPDQAAPTLQLGQGSHDRVRRDLLLRSPELDFQGNVPVHGQAGRPGLDTAPLLAQSQHRGGNHEVGSRQGGENQPATGGKTVVTKTRQTPHQRRDHLGKKRQGDDQ